MNSGPEWFSPSEEKAIAQLIEVEIDTAIEAKHIHEVVQDDEDEDDQ